MFPAHPSFLIAPSVFAMMPAKVETSVFWNEKPASHPRWRHEGRRKSGISPAMFLRRCGSVLHSGGAGDGGVCLGMPGRRTEPGDDGMDELPMGGARSRWTPPSFRPIHLTSPHRLRPTHLPAAAPRTCHMTIFEGHNLPPLPLTPRHLFRLSPLHSIFYILFAY